MSTPTNQGDKNFPPDRIQTEPGNNQQLKIANCSTFTKQ